MLKREIDKIVFDFLKTKGRIVTKLVKKNGQIFTYRAVVVINGKYESFTIEINKNTDKTDILNILNNLQRIELPQPDYSAITVSCY